MKKILSLFISLLAALNISAYNSLDPQNPIQFSGNKIIYNGETITLDENNIFLDGNLPDEIVRNQPFAFNDFKKAIEYTDNRHYGLDPQSQKNKVITHSAIAGQARNDGKQQITIYIAPFVYWIDNPDDPEIRRPNPDDTKKYGRARPYGMTVKAHNLHLRGLNPNPANIILASNRGQTQGAEGNFTMFHFLGDDLKVSHLTMGNYCNVDLEFPLKPSLNRPKRNNAIVQAQLAICEGDRIWAENVRFISRLNLNPLSTSQRSFFHNCYFESTDDALAPTGVYLGCTFKFFSSKPFAQTRGAGAVILDSDLYIVGNRKTQYMVKRNSPLALVDTRFHAESDSVKIGWIQDTDINPEHFYYQHHVTLNGKPVTLNGNTVDMTGKGVLEAYIVGGTYNIPNLLDNWNPIPTDNLSQYNIPTSVFIEKPAKDTIETGKDTLIIKAKQVLHHRMLSSAVLPKLTFAADTNFVRLINLQNSTCQIIPTNHTDDPKEVIIYATTESGLKAAKKIIVKPTTLPAPTFIKAPRIKRKGNELIVDYELNFRGATRDESEIMWLREDKIYEDSVQRIILPVFISRDTNQAKTYPLTKADAGRKIVVRVTPKSNRSEYGFEDSADIIVSEKYTSKLSENINTDFSNFPDKGFSIEYIKLNLPPKKGFWTISEHRPEGEFTEWNASATLSDQNGSPWSYGFGFDGAVNAKGLYQNRRGARLVYTPVDDSYGDMSLTAVLAPCKSAGQGFGSATGQYLDIYIKYDTQTMTGYGLRIVRTPDNDRSVNFVLMEYENGVATPLGRDAATSRDAARHVSTSVYRTNCTITLAVKGNILTATATTDAVYTDNRENIAKEVHLQAAITPNKFGGTGFQHTGTGNTNATVITHLKVDFGK